MTNLSLFPEDSPPPRESIGTAAYVLHGFALPYLDEILPAIQTVLREAPFRHMVTPGGFTMSVALTNCGSVGWTTDRHGYRYTETDPTTGRPWPEMPAVLRQLAQDAAAEAGFSHFDPDACLINHYVPGARMSLHQDKDERDFNAPIVSVSLGIPAIFLFGGLTRSDKTRRIPLVHGDVVVWGGQDRLRFHGIMPMKEDTHAVLGNQRINFTFRKAR